MSDAELPVDSYERWLADAGVKGFGEPLDHGDRDTFEAAA